MSDAQDPSAEAPTIVKRYANRKLYDTRRSCYVTLEELYQMVQQGEELRVIDNDSKKDLTAITLTQLIHEQEKRERRMPLGVLQTLIRRSEELQGFLDQRVVSPVSEIQETAQKSVEELKRSVGEIREGARSWGATATRSVTGAALRLFAKEERAAAEFKRNVVDHMDRLERRLDKRIAEVQEVLQASPDDAALRKHIRVAEHTALVRRRLKVLTDKTDELDALLAEVVSGHDDPEAPGPA